MTTVDRIAPIDGLHLHYVEWGPADAPPLVLLHGLTGHARTWDHLAAALVPRFRVIALDQRGHGDSARAPDGDYRVETMAADVAAFVRHLGLDRFALLGLSMGGRVAMAYAAAHPDRVERLAIVDIGPEIDPVGLERIRSAMAGSPERIESEADAVALMRLGNPLFTDAEIRHRVAHGFTRLADGGLTWKYDKALRDMMREGGRRDASDLWDPLGRIVCPTLVVRGAVSDILSPDTAKRMLDALRDGRLVEVDGAGHTVPGDKPDEFARVVAGFLNE